jgi:hypothetical protein
VPETVSHLFIGCVTAREVWYNLLEPIGLSTLMPMEDCDLGQWWLQQRARLDRSARPLFDSLLLLIAWTLWKERNGRVFGRAPSPVLDVVRAALKEGEEWALAGFAPLEAMHLLWSQHSFAL